MKKLKNLALATLLLLNLCLMAFADIQPIIWRAEVEYVGPPESRRYFFSCSASNLETGTLWIFEFNTNLATPNWAIFGNWFYTGQGYGYMPPYNSSGYETTNSNQLSVRMRQVGEDYEFYPDFDSSNLNSFNFSSRPFEYQDEAVSISALKSAPKVRRFNARQLFIPPSIDLIMPPVITNRFFH